MDRKSFLKNVTVAPIAGSGTKYAPNPNLLKIYDESLLKSGAYAVKVRLLPVDINAEEQKIPEVFFHTWGTGKTFRKVRCTGDRYKCPVCRENWEHHSHADEHDKDVSLMRVERYINCYVISNPADKESEGKVKIMKMPAKVYDLYVQATQGDRKDEFGPNKVFSLEEDGVTLVVNVKNNNGQVTYNDSYFMSEFASKKDIAALTEERKDEIWSKCFNIEAELADEFKQITDAEIIKYYVEQYCVPRNVTPYTEAVLSVYNGGVNGGANKATRVDVEDIAPSAPSTASAPKAPVAAPTPPSTAATAEVNLDLDNILAD